MLEFGGFPKEKQQQSSLKKNPGYGDVMTAAIQRLPKLDVSTENVNTGLSKGQKY